MDHRTHNALRTGLLAAAVALTALADTASATVIYDTTTMTDAHVYTINAQAQNFIGGAANNNGSFQDMQNCDDFTLAVPHAITSVTADFVTLAATPATAPSDGVLVEFFNSTSSTPQQTPFASFFASGSAITSSLFTNTVSTASFSTQGIRLSVDLSSFGIALDPGTWYVSIVPVDETANGLRYYSVSRTGTTLGLPAYRRSGGTAHGNGYSGFGDSGLWAAFSGSGRETAIRVDGAVIPAPGMSVITGVIGLVAVRRRRG